MHIGGTPTIRNSFVFPIICIFIPGERIFPALASGCGCGCVDVWLCFWSQPKINDVLQVLCICLMRSLINDSFDGLVFSLLPRAQYESLLLSFNLKPMLGIFSFFSLHIVLLIVFVMKLIKSKGF